MRTDSREAGSVCPNHILIIPYRRSGLCILRCQLVHLGSRLVNQRKHHIERNTMLLAESPGTDSIAMIHKIAGKDGREMQILAIITRQADTPDDSFVQPSPLIMLSCANSSFPSIKQGIFSRSTSLCFRETSASDKAHHNASAYSLENIHRHGTSRMQEHLVFLSPSQSLEE